MRSSLLLLIAAISLNASAQSLKLEGRQLRDWVDDVEQTVDVATEDTKVGYFAASGDNDEESAHALATTIADAICADRDMGRGKEFKLHKPERFRPIKDGHQPTGYYKMKRGDEFEVKLVSLPTEWVFANPISVLIGKQLPGNQEGLMETYAQPAWEFEEITCEP